MSPTHTAIRADPLTTSIWATVLDAVQTAVQSGFRITRRFYGLIRAWLLGQKGSNSTHERRL